MTSKVFVKTTTTGAFVRESSAFRNWIERGDAARFPPEKHRYHLYISLACPWACRCLAAMYMKGLDEFIGLSVVHPVFQRTRPNDPEDKHVGWAFVDPAKTPTLANPAGVGAFLSARSTPDEINGASFVRDLYEIAAGKEVATRFTVPLLWDKQKKTIVSNESADILRMFNSAFNELVTPAAAEIDLYPEGLREEIDTINEWVYNDINNGVYKCGFATTQEAYDSAVTALFDSLDRCEEILSNHRFLVGDRFTEADLRLFVTLIRFDEVYTVHFKANKRLIQQYPNLSNYVRDIYQMPPVKRSVDMEHIKTHYYASHSHLNPFGVIPVGPGVDFDLPHDRDRFATAFRPKF